MDSNRKELDHPADLQLVVLLVSGDQQSWKTFIEDYGRLIRSRVADVAQSFGFGSDWASIDDATADVIGALVANDFVAMRTYAGRSSLATYLAVIATRMATRSYARLRQHKLRYQDGQVDAFVANSVENPTHQLISSEERHKVLAVLQQLPERQREIVRLFHFEGQSYAAISHKLKIPLGSVGVTLSRAEDKLRELLQLPN